MKAWVLIVTVWSSNSGSIPLVIPGIADMAACDALLRQLEKMNRVPDQPSPSPLAKHPNCFEYEAARTNR
jgi:hypothetical protein